MTPDCNHCLHNLMTHACLYPQLHTCGYMMVWDLSCSVINFHNIPLPLHRRVLQCCTPVSPPLPWSSSENQWLDSLLSPCGANVTMLQDSLYVTRKPSFPQGFSDDTDLAKSPEIRRFSASIYLFLTANRQSPHAVSLFQTSTSREPA